MELSAAITVKLYVALYVRVYSNIGWPKSNVSKVRAYFSASDHMTRKIFSGVFRVSHWFEEYLKIIEIGDNFFRMNVHFSRFSPF